jgi:hypothetical protein
MILKTKTELLDITEKLEQVFNKVVTNPNFVSIAIGIAIFTRSLA